MVETNKADITGSKLTKEVCSLAIDLDILCESFLFLKSRYSAIFGLPSSLSPFSFHSLSLYPCLPSPILSLPCPFPSPSLSFPFPSLSLSFPSLPFPILHFPFVSLPFLLLPFPFPSAVGVYSYGRYCSIRGSAMLRFSSESSFSHWQFALTPPTA